jgi:uncharacterized membrane protein YfcA
VVVLGLILSLAIGLALGLLGGGGSILTVPVIHYVFGVGAHDAIAMSLGVVGVTSSVALIPHARARRVEWRVGLVFGAASMAAAFFGAQLGAALPGPVLITAFAMLMVVSGAVMLLRARRPPTASDGPVRVARVLVIGLGVGLLTGTLGAGGGFVIVPALTLFGGLAMREAVATSLLVITLNSMAGLAGTLQHASFDTRVAIAVTTFAVVGSFVGARIAKQVSATQLQRVFGWFVIAVGIAVLVREVC